VAQAIAQYGVGVRCATVAPGGTLVTAFNLTRRNRSPNGTLRNIPGGVTFRQPIICRFV
jgi:isocitrate dehydrogenase